MTLIRLAALAACAVTLSACVQTNAALMNPGERMAPTCPNGVALYSSAERVGHPYREVAMLNSKGGTTFTNEEKMIASMRKSAAEAGANGIILGAIGEPNAATKVLGAMFNVEPERKGTAMAIFVEAQENRVAAACGRR
jgi:hypothetical protein